MRIVYLCHYFYPEMGAPAARILELSREWVKMGHQVTVVTCFPNHPTGIIPKDYRGRLFRQETYQGIRVFRNFVLASPNEGVWRRTICHLSFVFSSIFLSLPRLGNVDVIIASSPTFFAGFAALVMSWIKKIPFIFEVRDLWPAAITELGVINFKLPIRILESWELFLYRRAQKVVVVTQSFKENLIARGVPESKIEIIYNGVDLERFSQVDSRTIRKKYQLEGRFVVLYTGALGLSHSLEYVLQAADRLRQSQNILFLFVGEGAMKDKLQKMARKLQLENVLFWPGQLRENMPDIYALADICLVSLKKIPLFTKVIPSKIFEIMAGGLPIVASLEGEAARILEESGSAIIIPQEDPAALENVIIRLINNPSTRQQMGRRGAEYVARHYDRKVLAGKYEEIIDFIHKNSYKKSNYNQDRRNSKNKSF